MLIPIRAIIWKCPTYQGRYLVHERSRYLEDCIYMVLHACRAAIESHDRNGKIRSWYCQLITRYQLITSRESSDRCGEHPSDNKLLTDYIIFLWYVPNERNTLWLKFDLWFNYESSCRCVNDSAHRNTVMLNYIILVCLICQFFKPIRLRSTELLNARG